MGTQCVTWHHLQVKKYVDTLHEGILFLLAYILMKSTGIAKEANYTLYHMPGKLCTE